MFLKYKSCRYSYRQLFLSGIFPEKIKVLGILIYTQCFRVTYRKNTRKIILSLSIEVTMIIRLYRKYKEAILYLLFGGCTTLVNVVTYYISTRILNINVIGSTILAWCLAVMFAYFTNRKLVFKSENNTAKTILIEFTSFLSCRLLTGTVDLGIMYVFVERLNLNDLLIKIISNLFVIGSNYIASRLLIFKHHSHD